MLLKALKPWYNPEHEGHVEPGQEFEASEFRADELIRIGLATAAVGVGQKISVPHDEPDPKPRQKRASR